MTTRQTMPPWTCMSDGLLSIQASLPRRKTSLWWVASKATERSWSWYKIHDIFQRALLIFFHKLTAEEEEESLFPSHCFVYMCYGPCAWNKLDWLIDLQNANIYSVSDNTHVVQCQVTRKAKAHQSCPPFAVGYAGEQFYSNTLMRCKCKK